MTDISSRVKLFHLDSLGQWEDKGIGLASIVSNSIEVLSEDTSEIALNCSIEDVDPHRQSDTILCWTDKSQNSYALSFQKIEGAELFWLNFCEASGCDKNTDKSFESCIPAPLVANIESILNFLASDSNWKYVQKSWLHELNKTTSENFQCTENMEKLFLIYKELINYAKFEIFLDILSDENFIAVFKVLEYDKDLSFSQGFGKYFEGQVGLNNFLRINDKGFIDKVNFAHRMLCLKEALMSKSFKEATVQILWNFHTLIWNDITTQFVGFPDVRAELIPKFAEPDMNAYTLLSELLYYSKFTVQSTRSMVFEALNSDGVLKTIQKVWVEDRDCSWKLRKIILDTFYSISMVSPKIIIDNFIACHQKYYITVLNDCIDGDLETLQKCMEMLKALMQPQQISAQQNFFQCLYDNVLGSYFLKLSSPEVQESSYDVVNEILSLFSHCLINDTFTIRYFIISNNLLTLVNSLIKTASFHIKISAIKLLKSAIQRKDSFLLKNLIKLDCLSAVLDVFSPVSSKENLFFSSVLSLFIEVQKSDHKPLLDYTAGILPNYKLGVLDSLFTSAKKPIVIEMRRPRTISFDLTAAEQFVDFEVDYNEFMNYDQDSAENSEVRESTLGKRQSDTYKSPHKKSKQE